MSLVPDHAPGLHLILDFYGGCSELGPDALREALIGAAEAADATVLAEHFHHFGGEGGVTGVVLLAESHMSIHTWPELGFAAIDIFMCGGSDAARAADHLSRVLAPDRIDRRDLARGQGNHSSQPSR
jgi:S-adenosylmethionine decarboxylase